MCVHDYYARVRWQKFIHSCVMFLYYLANCWYVYLKFNQTPILYVCPLSHHVQHVKLSIWNDLQCLYEILLILSHHFFCTSSCNFPLMQILINILLYFVQLGGSVLEKLILLKRTLKSADLMVKCLQFMFKYNILWWRSFP